MKTVMKAAALTLSAVILLVSLAACTKNTPDEDISSETDASSLVGSFVTEDLDGNKVTESILKEKEYTMINVWGSFCGPCIDEMPELEKLSKELPDNMQLIGVVGDLIYQFEDEGIRKDAMDIVKTTGVTYKNLLLWPEADKIIEKSQFVPTTFFVDSEGNMVGKMVVGADLDAYRAEIEKLKK